VPVPRRGNPLPIPGQARSRRKRDLKASLNEQQIFPRSSGSGGGSVPPALGSIPIPLPPGLPDPGINIQPVPGNGQAAPAVPGLLPETPNNANLPSVEAIINYLNSRFPNGIDPAHPDRGDIRRRLMFWTGGQAQAARTTAHRLGLYVLADLVGRNYVRYTSRGGGRTWDDVLPMWQRLSLAMARWAEGEVTVRIESDSDGARGTSVWNMYERPMLEQRGIRINWVGRNGRQRNPIYPPAQNNPANPGNGTGPRSLKKQSSVAKEKHKRSLLVARAKHMALLRRRRQQAISQRALLLKAKEKHIKRQMISEMESIAKIRRYHNLLQRRNVKGERNG
jgi:hypothetical protein